MTSVYPSPPLTSISDCKASFLAVTNDLIQFDSGDDGENQMRRKACAPIADILASGIFRVVVMGEIKKGKSSFINALLGEYELLPTDGDIATSTVYKVLYGAERRVTVFFVQDDDNRQAPIDISISEITRYGTEAGNPGNERKVAFIAIQTPNPLLRDGLVLVDTPGVGGLFKRHRYVTFEYAPSADAVLFIVDSVEAVISQDEISFLKELREHTSRIVFIQTKADMAGEEQVLAWKARNLAVISQTLGVPAESVPYFVVSSQLKAFAEQTQSLEILNDSGFPELLRFSQAVLIGDRDKLLMTRWLPSLRQVISQQKESLSARWQIANQGMAQNRPRLEQYAKELRQAEEAFISWQNERWPGIQRDYRNALSQLDRMSANAMEDATLPENSVAQIISDLRGSAKTPDEILQVDEQLRADHAAKLSADVSALIAGYKQAFDAIFRQTEASTWASLPPAHMPSIAVQSKESSEVDISKYRSMRETYMGTMFMSSLGRRVGAMSGAGLGVLVGLHVLTFGTATVVAAMGGLALVANEIWSYVRGYKQSRERQATEALRALEQALTKTCQTANRVGRRELNNLSAELKMAAEEVFVGFQKNLRSEYEQRRTAIEIARAQTLEESKGVVDQLTARLKQLEGLQRTVDTIAHRLTKA